MKFAILSACAALLLGATVSADEVLFTDDRPSSERGNVVADTMRRVVWKSGAQETSVEPWFVQRFVLRRSRGAASEKFEETWSDAMRKAISGGAKATTLKADLTAALALGKPVNYPDTEAAELRLRAGLVSATALALEDPTKAAGEYSALAKEAAKAFAKHLPASGKKIQKVADLPALEDYLGIDYAHLHSKAIDVFLTVGRYWREKGNLDKAWLDGYGPAGKLAEDARAALNLDDYASRFAVPILKEAAEMYTTTADPRWKNAADIYRRVEDASRLVRDRDTEQWAKLMGARCNLNQGELNAAERVYRDVLAPWERAQNSRKPGDRDWDWLTQEKASLYAQAKNGYGLIRLREGKHVEALQEFTTALGFFSADKEARAEALWNAAEINVELGKKADKAARDNYRKAADAYAIELMLTCAGTKFGDSVQQLRDRIAALAKQ